MRLSGGKCKHTCLSGGGNEQEHAQWTRLCEIVASEERVTLRVMKGLEKPSIVVKTNVTYNATQRTLCTVHVDLILNVGEERNVPVSAT